MCPQDQELQSGSTDVCICLNGNDPDNGCCDDNKEPDTTDPTGCACKNGNTVASNLSLIHI